MSARQVVRKLGGRGSPFRSLVYVPAETAPGGGPPWPLLLFLHGAGERGADPERLKKQGIPHLIEQTGDFPFATVSPQCPVGSFWTDLTAELGQVLDHALAELPVDPERVYLTGISTGGFGAWKLAAEAPDRFAAMIPICGGGDPAWATRLAHLPIWAFHGAEDAVVPPEESTRMIAALRALGAPARLTIYPAVGHDSWTSTYENPSLYTWMLQHRIGR